LDGYQLYSGISILGRKADYYVWQVSEHTLFPFPPDRYNVSCYAYRYPDTSTKTVIIVPDTIPTEIQDLCAARKMVETLLRILDGHHPILESEIHILVYMRSKMIPPEIRALYINHRKRDLMVILAGCSIRSPVVNKKYTYPEIVDLDNALDMLDEATLEFGKVAV